MIAVRTAAEDVQAEIYFRQTPAGVPIFSCRRDYCGFTESGEDFCANRFFRFFSCASISLTLSGS